MTTLNRLLALLAASVFATASTPALAATGASANAGAVVFTVVDLNLGDGITPVFTWLSQNALSVSVITRGPAFQFAENRDEAANWSASLAATTSAYGGVSNASVNALPGATQSSTSLDSTAIPAGNWSNSGAFAYFNGSFSLSGVGAVYASVPYQLNVDASCEGIVCNTASAGVGFESAQGNNGDLLRLDSEIQSFGTGFDSQTGVLSGLIIQNISGGVLDGNLLFGVNTSASAQPVPEPSTYAMLLIGLGIVAWVTRRHRV